MKVVSLGIALIGLLAVAYADDLRSQIEASNKAITTAMKKKDFAALSKHMKAGMTSNFTYIENGQKQTFNQMFDNMKMGLGMMKKVTVVKTKILTLKVKGNTATGTTEHQLGGIMVGPDKKDHTSVFTGVSQNTYVKEGTKWKMSKMVWTSQKMTQDGKTVTGMGG